MVSAVVYAKPQESGSGPGQTLLQKRNLCHEEQQWLLCSSALVAGVHAKCLLLRLSAGRQSITKRSKINHCARACANNHLMPTFSLWVSPRTKLSTAMSSETQLLSRRPDKKPRSKTGKNKLFFQKLRCFGIRCLLFASFFFFLRACA